MEILHYPDPRLSAKNKPLDGWSKEAEAMVSEMRKLCQGVNGAGIAAPQVGWNVKLFLLDLFDKEIGEQVERVVFNPSIKLLGDTVFMEEGCLSFPRICAPIKRCDRIELIGQTPEGPIDEVLIGFPAQAVQHEMDHLDGILFIERMTTADRTRWDPEIRWLEEDWKRRKA